VIVGRCAVCDVELDDAVVSIARRIVGWEAVRKGAGGANAVIDRVVLAEHVAHVECVKQRARARRKGINDGQGTLA
jgi:hypothetical protein